MVPQGAEKNESPLQIATADSNTISPLQIAFMRGHLDLCKAMMKIAEAQYVPAEIQEARYTMEQDDDEEMSDEGSDRDSDDDIRVTKAVVNDTFTIDNLAEVSLQVKSKITPLAFLKWKTPVSRFYDQGVLGPAKGAEAMDKSLREADCFFTYAVIADDVKLMDWLLDLGGHYAAREADKTPGSPRFLKLESGVFEKAIQLSRIKQLATLIAKTGAAIPLERLVKNSGVEVKQKSKYYQGLTVHGRKREDWVAASRGVTTSYVARTPPPLLMSAFKGSLDAIDFFMGDAALRQYLKFAEDYKDDKQLKNLGRASGGLDKAFSDFITTRGKLDDWSRAVPALEF